ncbi:MAG: hypothetical protein ACLRZ9_12975 [Eubacterium sp.]
MKLKRSYLLHYIDASFGGAGSPKWFLIGKDIEDMAVELNPDTETVKNILDETSINDNGYEPSMDADPYYANPEDSIYEHLRDIAMKRLTGDDCKTRILEVLIEDTSDAAHKAWTEDVIVKPQSYGGAQGGINIPYSVAFNGDRKEGTVSIADKVPTFTEASSS